MLAVNDNASFPENAVAIARQEPNMEIANCVANILAISYPRSF